MKDIVNCLAAGIVALLGWNECRVAFQVILGPSTQDDRTELHLCPFVWFILIVFFFSPIWSCSTCLSDPLQSSLFFERASWGETDLGEI